MGGTAAATLGILRAILWLTMAAVILSAASTRAAPPRAVKDSIVRVIVPPLGGVGEGSSGSGFKIGSGLYITNKHVVRRALAGTHEVFVVQSNDSAQPLRAEIVASTDGDLALLRTVDTADVPLTLTANIPESGEDVWALGYPGQMDDVLGLGGGTGSRSSVTKGAAINFGPGLTTLGGEITKIVHSASIWPGNSGGPLVDACNRVVGVNTMYHASEGLAQQNIAVSTADLLAFLRDNGVEATVDSRVCGEPPPPPPLDLSPQPPQPAPDAQADPGGGDIGAIVGVIVLALILGGGVFAVLRLRANSGAGSRPRSEFDEEGW